MAVQPIPAGFHTVTPYLFAKGVPRLIEFILAAFDAEVTSCKERPDGSIMHAEVRIGDSMLMMGEATDESGPCRPRSIYMSPIATVFTKGRWMRVGPWFLKS